MRLLSRLGRVALLVLLSTLATSALMYSAPGYFSDLREMDATHSTTARASLTQLHQNQASLPKLLLAEATAWAHGDLGQSRQFATPVTALLRERAARSATLLLAGVALGWSAALLLAVPFSLGRGVASGIALAATTAILLAVPVGALATVCLIANIARPALILAVIVAARDLKLLHRLLASTWQAPFVVHARAQGMGSAQILRAHLVPALWRQLLSLAVMSFTLALSALVPVEVIFDVPGLGQLAWTAAMNRDLPVLVAVTALVAACVGLASLALGPTRLAEDASCA